MSASDFTLFDSPQNVTAENHAGPTALMWAAFKNQADIVRNLIEGGADLDEIDDIGHGPCHYASIAGANDALKVLLDAGADINKRAEIRHGDGSEVCTCDCHEESRGETPLHFAAMNGRAETVVLLLACGANIDEKTWSKKTAGHYALEGMLYV